MVGLKEGGCPPLISSGFVRCALKALTDTVTGLHQAAVEGLHKLLVLLADVFKSPRQQRHLDVIDSAQQGQGFFVVEGDGGGFHGVVGSLCAPCWCLIEW